jgi:protein-disulfide isomerase
MMANQPKQPSRSRKQDLRSTRREQARLAAQREARRRRLMMIIGGVVGVAIIAAVVLILVNRDDSGNGSNLPAVSALSAPEITAQRDGLTLGDPNAPVNIIEYGDYQCPYCSIASKEGFRPMLDEYIATGKVHFTYVPMSFLGDESKAAAEAALCANDQGKFWEMHETVFANHSGENQGAYSRARLDSMAQNIGLNMDQFKTCMDSSQHEGEVANYANVATQAGVTSTPTFVINNGEPVGWSSWDALKSQIDAALGQ